MTFNFSTCLSISLSMKNLKKWIFNPLKKGNTPGNQRQINWPFPKILPSSSFKMDPKFRTSRSLKKKPRKNAVTMFQEVPNGNQVIAWFQNGSSIFWGKTNRISFLQKGLLKSMSNKDNFQVGQNRIGGGFMTPLAF